MGNRNREEGYKEVLESMMTHIIELEEELKMYKAFHDAILENNIIEEKFNDYRKVITKLENENAELKKKLKLS
tara:strand:- start:272 stop:490 length:219 start_codon:yes stop_codon:yes gene_type:complete